VPRQSTRTKKSKQQPTPGHVPSSATVALRHPEIEIRPGANQKDKAPIKLTVAHVLETNPPNDEEPVEWFLLTTCEVLAPRAGSADAALPLPALAHRGLAPSAQK